MWLKLLMCGQVLRIVLGELVACTRAHKLVVIRVMSGCQQCLMRIEGLAVSVRIEASVARVAVVELILR